MAIRHADNPAYSDMWQREQEELRREHQRLLYVAMTRARDHLVMIGALKDDRKPLKQNTWLEYLHTASPEPLFASPVEMPDGMRLYASPSIEGGVARTPAEAPVQKEDERVQLKQIDVRQVIDNLSPIPPSKTPEWKRASSASRRS
jgi:ATP-dependent exoDNAse (exonuclease V) beta subunit